MGAVWCGFRVMRAACCTAQLLPVSQAVLRTLSPGRRKCASYWSCQKPDTLPPPPAAVPGPARPPALPVMERAVWLKDAGRPATRRATTGWGGGEQGGGQYTLRAVGEGGATFLPRCPLYGAVGQQQGSQEMTYGV